MLFEGGIVQPLFMEDSWPIIEKDREVSKTFHDHTSDLSTVDMAHIYAAYGAGHRMGLHAIDKNCGYRDVEDFQTRPWLGDNAT